MSAPFRSAMDRFLEGDDQQDESMNESNDPDEFITPAAAARSSHSSPSPSSASSSPFGSVSAHPSAATMDPAEALRLTREHAQILILGLPPRTQIGIDYWSFQVGTKFTGMKMVPSGVHFIWTAPSILQPDASASLQQPGGRPQPQSMMMDPDMVPRIGEFVWFRPEDVWIRKWDAGLEALVPLESEEEEARYALGARRFDFDQGQGPYPLNESLRWRTLTNYITEQLVHRLEPVDRLIGVGKSKYTLEDKRPKAQSQEDQSMDAPSTDSNGDEKKSESDESDMADVIESPQTNADAQASKENKFKARPSVSFYTRIPTVASMVPATLDPAAKAARITELHLDQSDILEKILTESPATPSPEDAKLAPLTPAERDLLGELQFSFLAFLVGQDFEGFEAWKSLLILLTSCGRALTQHHVLYERLLAVLAMQLNSLPKDFFVDQLSGENFLRPAVSRLFSTAGEQPLPMSLIYAMKELREKLKEKFLWNINQLPEFKHREEVLEEQQQARSNQQLSQEQEAARLASFKRHLIESAEDDEYAPTIAEE